VSCEDLSYEMAKGSMFQVPSIRSAMWLAVFGLSVKKNW